MLIIAAGGFIHQSQRVYLGAGGMFVSDLVVMSDESACRQEKGRRKSDEIAETNRVHGEVRAVFSWHGLVLPPFNTTFRG